MSEELGRGSECWDQEVHAVPGAPRPPHGAAVYDGDGGRVRGLGDPGTLTVKVPGSTILTSMSDDVPTWPEHFPSGCPSPSEPGAQGEVYRLVKTDPPQLSDFESWLELGRGKGKDCQRAALSCVNALSHAIEQRKAYPTHRDKLIASATLTEDHGCLAQTGSQPHHYSLWLRREWLARATSLFKVVA